MNPDIVAVDVGGTTVKGARYSRSGDTLSAGVVPTPQGEAAIVAAILELCRSLRGPDTVAFGVVVPGVVDAVDGIARYSANLGWCDVPLRAVLVGELGLPVVLEHDVSAAALAECAGGAQDVLFVALGTGIAAGHIIRGELWRGASGTAGEIGHITVDPVGERCVCGQQGCLEGYASAAGIARRYAAAGGRQGVSSRDVVDCLDSDPLAARVWQEAVAALAIALATVVLIVDPAAIVLGGGLAEAGEALLEPLRKELAARLLWRPVPEVRSATIGSEAGRRGAAVLAWRLVCAEEGSAP